MTTTKRIREVLGKCVHQTGRGLKWLYVGDGRTRMTVDQNKSFIKKMTEAFETWKLVREVNGQRYVDFHFVITSKRGKVLGVAHIEDWNQQDDRFSIVDYVEGADPEVFHDYNRNYDHVTEYVKVDV